MSDKEITYEILKNLTDGLANLQTQVNGLQNWMQNVFNPNTTPYLYYGAGASNYTAMAYAQLDMLKEIIKTNAEQVHLLKKNEDTPSKPMPPEIRTLPF